ncbi:S4 domain-containing protein [Croceibacterium mercuriale]|uniref:S4 domain-containing protein n=1 Tax=Croceibacterium mercuriale TaxID=1572751 RepID=UPI000A9B4724|nr:S4 domain-containing protein [Croceibacterium mercuriale]
MSEGPAAQVLRLDKLLFALRLAKSRTLAQRWIAEGHMRRNGVRVLRIDQPVCPGDTLTLPLPDARGAPVLVIEILSLPLRRGPATEARMHYRAVGPALTGADHSP